MSMVQSRIEDGKDEKLEKALLSTIDELTEENNHVREQVEHLEEQLESQKAL
jgi:chemotaxis response regulator CheB